MSVLRNRYQFSANFIHPILADYYFLRIFWMIAWVSHIDHVFPCLVINHSPL